MTKNMAGEFDQLLPPLSDWPAGEAREVCQNYRDIWQSQGLPEPGRENWKYTPLQSKIASRAIISPVQALKPETAKKIFKIDNTSRLVIVNGRFDASLSDNIGADSIKQIKIDYQATDPLDLLNPEHYPLASLNAIAKPDTVQLTINPGQAGSLHIAHITESDQTNVDKLALAHPRLSIFLEENAEITVIESFQSFGDCFINPVFICNLKRGARLHHYVLQAESDNSIHTGFTLATLKRDALYDSFVAHKGSSVARRDIAVALEEENAETILNGLYYADASRHIDNSTRIDHIAPHCRSSEEYRGIADDKGRGVFQGKIVVHKEAQKTEGYQMSRAMLLSPAAEISHKPELEIYADDVKCSHGSTVTEPDAKQIFYLKARGIPDARAKKLVRQGFLAEMVDDLTPDGVRDFFKKELDLDMENDKNMNGQKAEPKK